MSPGEVFANDPEMREGLRKPFPPELIERLDTGFKADFVGHAAVTDRLLKEAPDFTYRIDHMEIQDGHLVGILGTMTIGGKSIQEAGAVDKKLAWGEELKRAISDFIRRGAMRFGVALDLWSKEDLQAKAETPSDWDAVEKRIKASGEPEVLGEGSEGSPENVSEAAGESPPLEHTVPAASDIPASAELWAEAIAKDWTKARIVAALKKAGAPVADASSVTDAQLRMLLNADKRVSA